MFSDVARKPDVPSVLVAVEPAVMKARQPPDVAANAVTQPTLGKAWRFTGLLQVPG